MAGRPQGRPVVARRPRGRFAAQKSAPVPCHGTRAPTLVVPPMFGAAGPLPQAFCCGKGTAPVSGPAGRAVSRPPCRGRFQPRRPLCSGGVDGTCPVRAVLLHNSIPIGRKSQWVFRQSRGGSPRRPGNAGVRPCACPIFRRPSAARAAAPQKRRAGAGGGGRARCYAVKGLVLGLTISRQSRSPRSRPWIRISAVATLVA